MDTNPNPEHLLVDGYNLIRAIPELQREDQISLERGRQRLEQAMLRYKSITKAQVTIFYDGDGTVNRPRAQHRQDLEIVFSQPPHIADDLIKERVQEKHGAKRVRVISADREIRRFAQRHKIRSTASADFAEELESPPPAPQPPNERPERRQPEELDPQELDRWEQLFNRRDPAPSDDRSQNNEAKDRELDEWERQFNQGRPDQK